MKVDLNDREQKQLKNVMEKNPLRKFLLNRGNLNFEVGDVLVKRLVRYNYNDKTTSWVTEPISSSNQMAQRYVVVFKDEFGISYLKQLKVSTGKLGNDLYCVADYDYDSTRFEVDPEYAEQIFLDGDFNIKDIHSKSLEARKIITKMNRKQGIKFKTLKDSNDFFSTLKPGDKYWCSADYTAKWVVEYEIVKVSQETTNKMESSNEWSWKSFKDNHVRNKTDKVAINDNFATKLTVKEIQHNYNSNRTRDIYAFDHGRDMVFYKSPPAREDKSK